MSAQGDQQGGATNASASGSWWGWGDSLLQTVKKQSETIISIYKEDLSEFTRTIKEDTLNVVKEVVHTTQEGTAAAVASSSTSTAASQQKRPNAGAGGRGGASSSSGLSNFFNFMESLKDEEEEEVLAKSRREKAIKKLQKDINTFTKEPDDAEDFKAWKAGFNLEARTVDISQLLAANNKLRAIHNELLPKLTYSVFWERYYYRLEKILKEEERREKILMRAELDSKLDDWEGWEDEEEPAGASTLSASADSTETSAVDDKEEPVQEGAERESVPHSGGSDEPSLEGNTPLVDSIPELDPAPVTDDAPPVAPSSSGSTTPQKTSGQQEASSSGPAVIAKEEVDDEKNNAEDESAASESAEEPPAQNVDEDALLEEELARRSLEGITEQPADEENKDDDWDAWE